MKVAITYAKTKTQSSLSTISIPPDGLVSLAERLDKRYPHNEKLRNYVRMFHGFLEDAEEDGPYVVEISYKDMREILPDLFHIGNSINESALTLLDGDGNRHKSNPEIQAYFGFMFVVSQMMTDNVKTSVLTLTEIY